MLNRRRSRRVLRYRPCRARLRADLILIAIEQAFVWDRLKKAPEGRHLELPPGVAGGHRGIAHAGPGPEQNESLMKYKPRRGGTLSDLLAQPEGQKGNPKSLTEEPRRGSKIR